MKKIIVINLGLLFSILNSCSIYKKAPNYNDICVDNLTYKQVIDTLVWSRYLREYDSSVFFKYDNISYKYIPVLAKQTKIPASYDHMSSAGVFIRSDSVFNMSIRKWANYVNYNSIVLPIPRNSMEVILELDD